MTGRRYATPGVVWVRATGRLPRAAPLLLALAVASTAAPFGLSGQLTDPCRLACGAVLGATGFVAATGASVAAGRITGGLSTVDQGLIVWGSAFTVVIGGGIALGGDGGRQERAVYSAGIGTAGGALLGLAVEAARTSDGPRMLAGALMGATAGAVIGGVVGALTHDDDGRSNPVPLFSVRLPL